MVLMSEPFPGLDLKGKEEKKEKEEGGREANSTGKSNNRLGAGYLPNLQRVCSRGFFWGGVKGSVAWGQMVPTLWVLNAQGSQALQILGASSSHPSGIFFGQKNQEKKKQFCL